VVPGKRARRIESRAHIADVRIDAVSAERFGVAVVAHRCREMEQFTGREGVGQVQAKDLVAAAQRNDRFVVEGTYVVNQGVIRRQVAVLKPLQIRVLRVLVVRAENGLIFPPEDVLRIRQLHTETCRALEQAGRGVLAGEAKGDVGTV